MDTDVKKVIKFFVKELSDYYDEDEFDWDEENQKVAIWSRESEDYTYCSRTDFLELPEEYKTLTHTAEGWVRTKMRTFRIVSPESDRIHLIEKDSAKLTMQLPGSATIHYRPKHFLVTIAAIKLKAHDKHYLPADSYQSVEIFYPQQMKKMPEHEEDNAIDSFCFELAASEKLVFKRTEFIVESPWDFDLSEVETEFIPKLRPLEAFNEGMRLFNNAVQVNDPELQLLSLFKVLEYFGPIVVALDSNEALRKKLDSPSALNPDANYLQSILELARSLEKRRTDNEMIRLLLEKCVDMVDLSKRLPRSRFKELNYEDKKPEIESQTRQVADALVATRNQVAHAKSDYRPTGSELIKEDLPAFNAFVEAAAVQTIRWYNRLPSHLKLQL